MGRSGRRWSDRRRRGHEDGHDHGQGSSRSRLLVALVITTTILVVEAIGAYVSGSLALRADAVVSLLIGVLILPRTLKLLRETTEVLLEATPRGVDLAAVRTHLLALDHVMAVHDLHASTITTGLPALSAHVVVQDSCFHDGHAPLVLDALQTCVIRV